MDCLHTILLVWCITFGITSVMFVLWQLILDGQSSPSWVTVWAVLLEAFSHPSPLKWSTDLWWLISSSPSRFQPSSNLTNRWKLSRAICRCSRSWNKDRLLTRMKLHVNDCFRPITARWTSKLLTSLCDEELNATKTVDTTLLAISAM